jgi:hypothetical protein
MVPICFKHTRHPPVADTQRERLKRACNFWLEGELARDVKAPADFYERMRDICILADTANDEVLVIALEGVRNARTGLRRSLSRTVT